MQAWTPELPIWWPLVLHGGAAWALALAMPALQPKGWHCKAMLAQLHALACLPAILHDRPVILGQSPFTQVTLTLAHARVHACARIAHARIHACVWIAHAVVHASVWIAHAGGHTVPLAYWLHPNTAVSFSITVWPPKGATLIVANRLAIG